MHERAPQKHIGLYFLIWYGAINDSIGQNTDIEKIYMNKLCERARSERAWSFSHFHILKLLISSIFCWYIIHF